MKYFKLIGIMTLLVFSFNLTDFVTELAINSNPLMETIKENSEIYKIESVNAIIKDNTIIPGIRGKKVNEMESFFNMKDFGSFNDNYIIYDDFKPKISLEDNLDKVIISGNKNKREISILIKDNKNILDYLIKNNIKYSKLIDCYDEIDQNENIIIENDNDKFKTLNGLLNKKNKNKRICLINYSNIDECIKNKYYLVKSNITLSNNNIFNILNNIELGSIILIDNNLTRENFLIFINKIRNNDINFVYLSELIKE